MPLFPLWSKRQQQPKEHPDVYQYDRLPDPFRKQVFHILNATLGTYIQAYNPFVYSSGPPAANERWTALFSRYTREVGVFTLGDDPDANPYLQCLHYLQVAPTQQALDFIDCAFHYIDEDLRRDTAYFVRIPGAGYQVSHQLDEAIEELNQRFREHLIGYQFQSGQLIKQTDHYLHEEVVVPALVLLSNPQFRGAQEEFLTAHRYYREGRYKEAIANTLKAFESTMKSILDEQGWAYEKEKDTASKLIQIIFDHHLLPAMVQSQFTHLRGLLESGLPPVRNRTSGHGQGAEPVPVPKYVAEYALHMAATNIVFLVQAYDSYGQGGYTREHGA